MSISISHDIWLSKGSPGLFTVHVGRESLSAEEMRELAYAILAIVQAHEEKR